MPYDRVALVIIKGVVGSIPTISSIMKHKSASWSLLGQDTTFYKLMFCDEIMGPMQILNKLMNSNMLKW